MKHLPFQPGYREEFEVAEQQQDCLRLFPYTDRLPVLYRALNLEFYNALSGYVAGLALRRLEH